MVAKVLIIYHSQSGTTRQLAEQVQAGIMQEAGAECRFLTAFEAGLEDLLWCDGLLIGSPENFGYMSGAIKDFFDRTYDAAQPHQLNLPYALFISAGNDGSGAVRAIDRILLGYPMRKIAEPVVIKKEPDANALAACRDLGLTMAAGLVMGIY
jgi:multimeric flavodoxin WrbA